MMSLPDVFSFSFVLTANFVLVSIFGGGDVLADTEFELGSNSMKLLGNAHMINRSVSLTRDVIVPYSGAGKVIYSKPIEFRRPGAQSQASFSTLFTFSVANLNPSSIGGGLAFVISTDGEYIGDAGGYLGVTDAKGAAARNGVVAVEFDTLMDVEFNDINGNHVGLDLNSMVSTEVGDLGTIGVDLKSGGSVNSWVDYSGSTRSIKVYVSYSILKPQEPIISATVDLNEYLLNDSMFVGFSGSTQGSTETHTIESWSFKSSFDENPISNAPPAPSDLTNSTTAPPPYLSPQAHENSNTTTSHEEKKVIRPGAIVGVVTASALFLAFWAFAFILWAYNKKFNGGKNPVNLASGMIKMPKEFSYKELKLATKGFDPDKIIGYGAFGTVYRGILAATGEIVAVKRCSHKGQGKTEFFSELSIIGTLRHRNLVRLQGWCHEKGEILLVYDMMCNGSLDKSLFESRMILSWTHRRKILLGVASALTYLHEECENQVIHRDIKSSNIMLDEGFNARLGDFGLAREIEHDKSADATVAAGTMGYLAPEYLLTGRATDKTDVFSYGAVVLEVATGRRPIEREFKDSSNLVEWVWSLHREGELMAAVDRRLGNEFDEVEMRRALLVGLACSNPDPTGRPGMRGVVQMLLGDCEVPIVTRIKPATSFSTSQLLMTLQDSVSDLNGMITFSTTSSENSGGGGGSVSGIELV